MVTIRKSHSQRAAREFSVWNWTGNALGGPDLASPTKQKAQNIDISFHYISSRWR
jgi:hypothetical protein